MAGVHSLVKAAERRLGGRMTRGIQTTTDLLLLLVGDFLGRAYYEVKMC